MTATTLFLADSAQAVTISSNFNWWSGDFSQTTIDDIDVTLETENVEQYFETTSIRDLTGPTPGTYSFKFSEEIESFTANFSRFAPFESLISFNIAPTSTTGDLFIESSSVTSSSSNDFGAGSINWNGLNTNTISFATSTANGAIKFDSFQATTAENSNSQLVLALL